MSAVAKWYGHAPFAGIEWLGDSMKVVLLDPTFTPDQDVQQFYADVVAHEVSGSGYVAGGVTLTGKTKVYDAPSNKTTLNADNVAWANASFTARYAAIYKDTGNPATAPLMGYVDLGASQTVGGSTFTIGWNASGIFDGTPA